MKRKSIRLLAPALLLFTLFSGLAICPVKAGVVIKLTEYQITTDTSDQFAVAIYGYRIVYQDDRNGNWDIYMYQLMNAFEPESQITSNTANQIAPKIYENRIVYMDDRNGNWDIYMYDLSTQTETQITTNTAAQQYPSIYENRIVYQDYRNANWDIYMTDISTQTETQITSSAGADQYPDIYNYHIVYQSSDFVGEVFVYEQLTGIATRVSQQAPWFLMYSNLQRPAIYGDTIVYQATKYASLYDQNNNDIYWHNALTGSDLQITNVGPQQYAPDIWGNYVVWTQNQGYNNYDIYLYNLGTQTLTQITANPSAQGDPKIFGGRIVYVDDRNGNLDIYLTEVSYVTQIGGPPQTPTPEYAITKIENIKNIIDDPSQIPPSDISGANRRDTLLNKLDAVIDDIQDAADSTNTKKQKAYYQSALDQLNSILEKTDGYLSRGTPDSNGSGFTPDWITTAASQELIEPMVRNAIGIIRALKAG